MVLAGLFRPQHIFLNRLPVFSMLALDTLAFGHRVPHTMNLLLLQSYPDSQLFARFFRHEDCPPLSSIIRLSVPPLDSIPRQSPTADAELDPQHPDHPVSVVGEGWAEWGTLFVVPKAGCYVVEVSWAAGHWSVTFAAGA